MLVLLFLALFVTQPAPPASAQATPRPPASPPAKAAAVAPQGPYARVQEAKQALDAGQYERVLKIVDPLLKEYPRSQSSHLLRALALDELGRWDEAQRSYEAALRIAPKDPQIQARLGMHFVRRERWADAIPPLERSVAGAEDALTLFYLSQAYFQTQNKGKALETIERCARLAPDNPTMLLKLGEYRAQMGKHSPALEALLRVQKLNLDEPGLDLALGNTYLSLLEVENARTALERALQKDPKNPAVISALASACSKARDHAAARRYYQQVLDLGYDDAEYHLGLGAALLGLGENEAAIVQLNEAISRKPRLEEAHFHLARAYQAAGHAEESRRELGLFRALKASPLDPPEERSELERDLWRQAEALVREGKEKEALKLLTHTNVKGNTPEYLVGALYYRLGRLPDAERLLAQAAEGSPNLPNVRTYLALAYVEQGRLAEAEAILPGELERNPREPLVLMAMGLLRFRQERWADAARYLSDSRVVDPGVLLRLCEAQIRLGQPSQAQDTARVVTALAAGKPDTMTALENMFERHGIPLEAEPLPSRNVP
ncbi:MAG TPA: tetratricopeptide repeat protein [Vicinamibacteria bacterium]|nr:tetratricopeptide repeat protein [Vicinamibacteria bacterium]